MKKHFLQYRLIKIFSSKTILIILFQGSYVHSYLSFLRLRRMDVEEDNTFRISVQLNIPGVGMNPHGEQIAFHSRGMVSVI